MYPLRHPLSHSRRINILPNIKNQYFHDNSVSSFIIHSFYDEIQIHGTGDGDEFRNEGDVVLTMKPGTEVSSIIHGTYLRPWFRFVPCGTRLRPRFRASGYAINNISQL